MKKLFCYELSFGLGGGVFFMRKFEIEEKEKWEDFLKDIFKNSELEEEEDVMEYYENWFNGDEFSEENVVEGSRKDNKNKFNLLLEEEYNIFCSREDLGDSMEEVEKVYNDFIEKLY